MRKHSFLLPLLMLIMAWTSLSAQSTESTNSKFDPTRLIYGGDIGFAISNNSWTVAVSPQIGYRLTDQFHFGAGIGYRFGKLSEANYYYYPSEGDDYYWETLMLRQTEHSASFNLFANYYPWKKLVFSIRPEIMHTWYRGSFGSEKYSENKFIPAVIVGGGVHLKPFILQLNYELVQDKYSPYSEDIFLSVGFIF